jgi:hypothetical protein
MLFFYKGKKKGKRERRLVLSGTFGIKKEDSSCENNSPFVWICSSKHKFT